MTLRAIEFYPPLYIRNRVSTMNTNSYMHFWGDYRNDYRFDCFGCVKKKDRTGTETNGG
ncbi:MAG: hypothetical protein A4E65_03031 [Syntrophorhabdus sp. PtaU1.Bin153]|nr:MAG: hypothetical protein A4E65_03031 [Syntrophorhabdus sp. PtaU1.Bin153]